MGKDAEAYCVGYVKGSLGQCNKAKEKFAQGSVCALSKVVLDSFTAVQYISTPVPFRVDLAKSNVLILDRTPETHAALYDTMPTHPVPP